MLPNRSTQKVKESASASTQNWIKKLTEGGRGVKSQDFPDGHAELKKKPKTKNKTTEKSRKANQKWLSMYVHFGNNEVS